MIVSVIMGVYNCASTLQEALDSLYAQTFKDFEIILCDDGSSDDSLRIAIDNKAKHSNITVIKNDRNLGLNTTLNKCLAVASGIYIARMDGDDISHPTRFEKEVSFLDEHPQFAVVSSPMIYFDENGEFGQSKVVTIPSKDSLNFGSPFCHAPCMIRRSALIAVGGYTVHPRLIRYEDYNLWMKLFKAGYKGYNLDECLYSMRDDRNAVKRRTLRGRINGIYAHWLAYKELDLSLLSFLRFSTLSLLKGLLPYPVYNYFHHRKVGRVR